MSHFLYKLILGWGGLRTTHLTSGVETAPDTHDPCQSVNRVREMCWINTNSRTSPTSHISPFIVSRLSNGNLVAIISTPIVVSSSLPLIWNAAVCSFVIFEEKSLKINYNKWTHHLKKAILRYKHTTPSMLVITDNSSRLTQLSQRFRIPSALTKDGWR